MNLLLWCYIIQASEMLIAVAAVITVIIREKQN